MTAATEDRFAGLLETEGIDDPDTVMAWERIALGKLMLTDGADQLIDRLRPEDFLSVPHEYIYASLQAHADKVVDVMGALADLAAVRQVTSIYDPASYLSNCRTKAESAVGDFGWYATRVRHAAEWRNAKAMVERAQQALKSRNMETLRRVLEEAATGVSEPPNSSSGVRLRSASSFTMKGTRWLMKGRIPAGMMTLLAGREGIGKSTVALDIAARLTRGTLEGRHEGRPQNVVLCATEDSWEHTIIPRLRAVNADLDRVFHIAVQDDAGGFRAISAPGDIRAIEKVIKQTQPALLIIDPLMSVIDGRIDTHNQKQVQQGLEPLIAMCGRAAMGVLGLIHVNKSNSLDALNSIMGSKAFASLPRSVLFCIADPTEEGAYLFTHEKCNVGPKETSIVYRLASVRFDLDPDEVDEGDEPFIHTSRVAWGEADERKAGDILAEQAAGQSFGDLRKSLREYIDSRPGVVAAADLVAEFEDVDVTRTNIDKTLKRMVGKGEIDKPTRGFYQSMKVAAKVA